MAFKIGKDCVLYVSATPMTIASPTAGVQNSDFATAITGSGVTTVPNISDVKISLKTDKTDTSTRGGSGWKQSQPTLKDGTLTGTMFYQASDPVFAIFKAAYLSGAELFCAALDGPNATGAQGPSGNFTVTDFSQDQKLTDAVSVSVELSPSSFTGWYVHA